MPVCPARQTAGRFLRQRAYAAKRAHFSAIEVKWPMQTHIDDACDTALDIICTRGLFYIDM